MLEFQVMQLWFFECEGRLEIMGLSDPFLSQSVDLILDLTGLKDIIIIPPLPNLIRNPLKIRPLNRISLQVELHPLGIDIRLQLQQYLLLLQYLLLPIFLLLLLLLMQVLFLLPHLRD